MSDVPCRATVRIQTKHDTTAEAHVWACALPKCTVVGTPPLPGNVRVVVEVASGPDLAYVLDALDEDDVCFAYEVGPGTVALRPARVEVSAANADA